MAKPFEKPSTLPSAPSLAPKRDTSSVSETLTNSEVESLRQSARELNDYGRKAFAQKTPG